MCNNQKFTKLKMEDNKSDECNSLRLKRKKIDV